MSSNFGYDSGDYGLIEFPMSGDLAPFMSCQFGNRTKCHACEMTGQTGQVVSGSIFAIRLVE
jgi:hypothetical protein